MAEYFLTPKQFWAVRDSKAWYSIESHKEVKKDNKIMYVIQAGRSPEINNQIKKALVDIEKKDT